MLVAIRRWLRLSLLMRRSHSTSQPLKEFAAIFFIAASASIACADAPATFPPTASLADVRKLVDACSPAHPRLLANADELANLKVAVEQDPLKQLIAKEVLRKADATLGQPPVERVMVGIRLLSTSRLCLERVLTLALAYHLTGGDRYAARCEAEMLAAARFEDWNPAHFLDVAEMTFALAVGYDWLFDRLDPDARKEIREAIIEKGVRLQFNPSRSGWVRKANNWSQVCHAGLVAGAIAVLEEDRDLTARTIHSAIQNVVPAMKQYAPNGGYPEGPHYWSYGTSYNVILIDALEHAVGTDFGLSLAPGFDETGGFLSQVCGPTGEYFNYSDGGADREPQTALPWLAARYERPDWLAGELVRWEKATGPDGVARAEALRYFPLALLWSEANASASAAVDDARTSRLPLHWTSGGLTPISVHRSAWTPQATFVALKGGSPSTSHSHMDGGSFVLESDGVRWAVDLGREDYQTVDAHGLAAWKFDQNSDRWKIFKYNNHGHNTLAIDGQLQHAAGNATIVEFSAAPSHPYSIVDLDELYQEQAATARRGVALLPTGAVVIRDELTGLQPGSEVRWGMITRAEAANLDATVARLSQGGQSLKLYVREPADAAWHLIDVSQPPQPWDSPNPECRKLELTVVTPASGRLAIDVLAVPGSSAVKRPSTVETRSLDEWSNFPTPAPISQ